MNYAYLNISLYLSSSLLLMISPVKLTWLTTVVNIVNSYVTNLLFKAIFNRIFYCQFTKTRFDSELRNPKVLYTRWHASVIRNIWYESYHAMFFFTKLISRVVIPTWSLGSSKFENHLPVGSVIVKSDKTCK